MLSFETFLTIRQNSLYVTVCMIARSSYRGYFIHSLSTLHYCNAPSLATRLTGDYRDRTYTGKCSPALLDTPKKKKGGLAQPHAHAGPPSKPGRMPLSRQLCQLGQYLMHPIPQSLLPPGYILQVGVVNAPGFMRTAGQLV